MRYFEERYPERLKELESELEPICDEILMNIDNEDLVRKLMEDFRQQILKFAEITRSHVVFLKIYLTEEHLHKVKPSYISESFQNPSIRIIFNNIFKIK